MLLLIIATNALSQDQEPDTLTLDDFYIDFAVPDIAANSLLGIEADNIVRPGNLKEFGAALTSVVGVNGDLNPALALEYAPFISLLKKEEKYWEPGFKWQNLAFSLASQVDDSLGSRLAIGFKWVPIDYSEPLGNKVFYDKVGDFLKSQEPAEWSIKANNFQNKVLEQVTLAFGGIDSDDAMSVLKLYEISNEEYRESLRKMYKEGLIGSFSKHITSKADSISTYKSLESSRKAEFVKLADEFAALMIVKYSNIFSKSITEFIKKEKEAFKKTHWNAAVIQISAGWVYNSATSNYKDLKEEKFSSFLGVALPLGAKSSKSWLSNHGQIIVHIQYTMDNTMLTAYANRFSSGGRLLFGNSDNRLSIEGMYSKSTMDMEGMADEEYFRWNIGGEIKMSSGSWLEIGIGGMKQFQGETGILPSFGIKHALQNKKRLNTN